VVSGKYTVRSSADGWIVRAGSTTPERVAALTKVMAGPPGDTTVFRNESNVTCAIAGTEPV